jgi:UDP-glucose 4-epimerase
MEAAPLDHTIVNLGTGRGLSVLEVVHAFIQASGRAVPFEIVERRAGDVAASFADASLAAACFNWRARFDLDRMCSDAWRWQAANPCGLAGP